MKRNPFAFNERHVIYNWEPSPESSLDLQLVRYNICVSDDKYRENKISKILSNFQEKSIMNFSFNEVMAREGKHAGTDFRYLFVVLDTQYTPKFLDFGGVSNNVKRDFDLKRRKVGTIEEYVHQMYGARGEQIIIYQAIPQIVG